jgi:CubicO group peptidase (beta-lactamase class C family)
MRKLFCVAVFVLCTIVTGKIAAQNSQLVFPGKAWETVDPEHLGWSSAKLEEAHKYFETLPPGNAVVVDRGRIVAEWGDSSQRIKISSARKSLLSALYGVYAHKGKFDLNQTLEQLGIDDDPPLTPLEKQATLQMLLEARSGVYHPFVGGTPNMKAEQPPRGSHSPGTFWYYNQWDFNVLGSIFEQRVHSKIGVEFRDRIATPIQMQDFRAEDTYYIRVTPETASFEKSIYPMYHFRVSARDLARFGYLYLRRGNWDGTQVIPGDWIEESTRAYSITGRRLADAGESGGYGYLWWVDSYGLPVKNFSAMGSLGKYLVVIPEREMVVVFLNHTEWPDDAPLIPESELNKLPDVSRSQIGQFVKLLLDAQRGTSEAGYIR